MNPHTEARRATDAVVVGGGIGGLAVAGGLVRAGWRVTVVERADRIAPVGAGIAVEPNAVKALRWLGLGDQLAARGMAQGSAELRTARGRRLVRSQLSALQDRFGVPAYALHRSDLHGMLLDAADGAELRTGAEVVQVEPDGVAVLVRSDGRHELLHGDVVIGADGIRSAVRRSVFPAHADPAYAGYVTWRGVVDADAAAGLDLPPAVTETWGRGLRFGIVPLADKRVYWFACASGPEGYGRDDTLSEVAARYAGWHEPIPRLLAATRPETLLRHDIHYLEDELPSYVRGRLVLLGDAAHAITPDLGQGAALALEDAVVLTAALTGHADDVPAALTVYDRARRDRTQRLVRASAKVGRVGQWRKPVAAALRDGLAALVPTSALLNLTADAFDWNPPETGPESPTQRATQKPGAPR